MVELPSTAEMVAASKVAIKIDYPNGVAINLYCELSSKILGELKPLLEV